MQKTMNNIYDDIAAKSDNGLKYHREVKWGIEKDGKIYVDFYAISKTVGIKHNFIDHAAKKLLYCGLRNKATMIDDLKEAVTAIVRGIQGLESEKNEYGAKDMFSDSLKPPPAPVFDPKDEKIVSATNPNLSSVSPFTVPGKPKFPDTCQDESGLSELQKSIGPLSDSENVILTGRYGTKMIREILVDGHRIVNGTPVALRKDLKDGEMYGGSIFAQEILLLKPGEVGIAHELKEYIIPFKRYGMSILKSYDQSSDAEYDLEMIDIERTKNLVIINNDIIERLMDEKMIIDLGSNAKMVGNIFDDIINKMPTVGVSDESKNPVYDFNNSKIVSGTPKNPVSTFEEDQNIANEFGFKEDPSYPKVSVSGVKVTDELTLCEGDPVKLRSDLKDGKRYGEYTYSSKMMFELGHIGNAISLGTNSGSSMSFLFKDDKNLMRYSFEMIDVQATLILQRSVIKRSLTTLKSRWQNLLMTYHY